MGRVIDGRFELLERLGGGGMGTVWRARDLVLRREVAIKEVRPPDPAYADVDPEGARMLRARVLREARALARIDHPHVVTVHHVVDSADEAYPWIVMELVAGGSLQERCDRGPMDPRAAARLGRQVLSALRAAHDAGVEHRDVKPANVLLRANGAPVLTDFGIAAVRESTNLTATGSVIGTPDYMAPERVSGKDSGPEADLWSLGMLLYVAVEGHHPLRRQNTLATLAAVLSEDVPPPRRAGPLAGALVSLLVRDPGARPDAATLDGMLASAADGNPTVPLVPRDALAPRPLPSPPPRTGPGGPPWPGPHTPLPVPSAPGNRRVRVLVGAGLVLGLAGTAVAGVLGWRSLTSDDGKADDAERPRTSVSSTVTGTNAGTGTDAGTGANAGTGTDDTPEAPSTPKKVNLLTADGIRTAIDKLEPVMGGTEVTGFVVYPDYVVAEALVKGSTNRYDRFSYRGGDVAIRDGAGGTVITGTVPVDLDTYDWDAVPALLRRADRDLGVAEPTHRYLVVDPPSTVFNTEAGLSIYLSDDYASSYLEADRQGKVTDVHARED
nr:serine/threonine-protein kinase [Wenjunlia vitaminophila]